MKGRLTKVIAVGSTLVLPWIVASCSSVPDEANPVEWYRGAEDALFGEGDDGSPEAETAAGGAYAAPDATPGADQPFPNLADVPERPETSTAEERQRLAEGLVADRDQRRYSDEVIPLQGPSETQLAASEPGGYTSRPAPRAVTGLESLPERSEDGSEPKPRISTPDSPDQDSPLPEPELATPPPEPDETQSERTAEPVRTRPEPAEMTRREPAPPPSPTAVTRSSPAAASAPVTARQRSAPAVGSFASPQPEPERAPPPPPAAAGDFEPRMVSALPQPQPPMAPATLSPRTTILPREMRPITTVVVSSSGVQSLDSGPVLRQSVSGVPSRYARREPVGASPYAPTNPATFPSALPAGAVSQAVPMDQLPASGLVRVATIYFADGAASLGSRDIAILRDVADLHRRRGGVIRVVGHASSRTRSMEPTRHDMVNFQISMERANAVARALRRQGVPRDGVVVDSVSDNQPLYLEVMPSGEAGNRRAEVFIEY